MFTLIGNFLKRRKIKKAVTKWKPQQTVEQLVHSIANGLVENLEQAGMKPEEIEKAVHENNKFIVQAVEQGVDLMDLCDQVKDAVLAKDSALERMESVVIESQGCAATEKSPEGDGVLTSTAKKVGGKIKNVINKVKPGENSDDSAEVNTKGANAGGAPAAAGAGA